MNRAERRRLERERKCPEVSREIECPKHSGSHGKVVAKHLTLEEARKLYPNAVVVDDD